MIPDYSTPMDLALAVRSGSLSHDEAVAVLVAAGFAAAAQLLDELIDLAGGTP